MTNKTTPRLAYVIYSGWVSMEIPTHITGQEAYDLTSGLVVKESKSGCYSLIEVATEYAERLNASKKEEVK